MAVLYGTMQNGQLVAVEADAQGRLVAQLADDQLAGTTCKAWVNFNGTGTAAISSNYNVSSITDHGTGLYTVHFTTPLEDAFYAVSLCAGNVGTNGLFSPTAYVDDNASNPTASAVRIKVVQSTNAVTIDLQALYVAIFR